MTLGQALPSVVAAFLIGSIPFGLLVARIFYKTDIRAAGSGNIGAANALRTLGRTAGIAVLALDALKGAVATAVPFAIVSALDAAPLRAQLAQDAAVLAAACGLAAIVGHCYSPWLNFRGGKGVATFLGVSIVAAWPSALAFAAVWTAIVLRAGYASVGSLAGSLVAIVVVALLVGPWTLIFSIPAFGLIVWKHRDNLGRLYTGHESKLKLV